MRDWYRVWSLASLRSAALPGHAGSPAGQSMPLAADPSSSFVSAKSRDGCRAVSEGGSL